MMSRNAFFRRLALLTFLFTLASTCVTKSASPADSNTLAVMTYNLRFASATGPNAWPDRRPVMVEVIRNAAPDVIGTQEGVYSQLKDLAADLPGYEWIGLGREGGSKGEFMAVFYRKTRLEPLAFDHFWLSDTPSVIGSTTWGNTVKRMVTWVQFRDLTTRREFYLVNTHFDHQIQEARVRSAELLKSRLQELNTRLPILVTGDFNCTTNNQAYQILMGDGFLKDTWYMSPVRQGDGLNSFNGFKAVEKNDSRIDWILARGAVEALRTEIVTRWQEERFASDHLPVMTWVRLND